jgi:hypothetical protein
VQHVASVGVGVGVGLAEGGAWPPMLWIGGAQGAGKSTLAWALARAYDLPLHPVDMWAYDHAGRMPARESLEDELARGPEAAADAFEATSRVRLGLVVADIVARGLGEVPALVEGPQLSPALAGPLPAGYGVWLVPDPERTRLARQQRLAKEEALAGGPATGRSRTEGLLHRDAALAARIRRAAARSGRPVIEVPAVPDWPAITAHVESALGTALRSSPRLGPGPALSRQRRVENAAAARQGRLWMDRAALAAAPAYPFGCECGRSRCRATWLATPDDYETSAAVSPLVTHREDE